MKVSDGYMLKTIADTNIVVPIGENSIDFKAVVSLNDSGAFLWKQLETESTENELLGAMLDEYDVDSDIAKADISEFLDNMKKANLLIV